MTIESLPFSYIIRMKFTIFSNINEYLWYNSTMDNDIYKDIIG